MIRLKFELHRFAVVAVYQLSTVAQTYWIWYVWYSSVGTQCFFLFSLFGPLFGVDVLIYVFSFNASILCNSLTIVCNEGQEKRFVSRIDTVDTLTHSANCLDVRFLILLSISSLAAAAPSSSACCFYSIISSVGSSTLSAWIDVKFNVCRVCIRSSEHVYHMTTTTMMIITKWGRRRCCTVVCRVHFIYRCECSTVDDANVTIRFFEFCRCWCCCWCCTFRFMFPLLLRIIICCALSFTINQFDGECTCGVCACIVLSHSSTVFFCKILWPAHELFGLPLCVKFAIYDGRQRAAHTYSVFNTTGQQQERKGNNKNATDEQNQNRIQQFTVNIYECGAAVRRVANVFPSSYFACSVLLFLDIFYYYYYFLCVGLVRCVVRCVVATECELFSMEYGCVVMVNTTTPKYCWSMATVAYRYRCNESKRMQRRDASAFFLFGVW